MEKYVESGYVIVDYVQGDEYSELFESIISFEIIDNITSVDYVFYVTDSVTSEPIRLKHDTDVFLSDGKILTIPSSVTTYTYTIDKTSKIKSVETKSGTKIDDVNALFVEVNGVLISLEEISDGNIVTKTIKTNVPVGDNLKAVLTTGEELYLVGTKTETTVVVDQTEPAKLTKIRTVDETGEDMVIIPKTSAGAAVKFEEETDVFLPQMIYHTKNNGDEMLGEMNISIGSLIFENIDFQNESKSYYKYDNTLLNKLELFKNLKASMLKRTI